MSLSVGLVGLGEIARTRHLPALREVEGLHLAAIASRHAQLEGVPSYQDVKAMLAGEPRLDVVSLCTPPQGRFEQAMAVLGAGRHLMLEKPPGASLAELEILRSEAARRQVSIFATWHAREAAAVNVAREWLAARRLRAVRLVWKEDVHKWHPNQQWMWQPGGLGVFDMGINALSILTALFGKAIRLLSADLSVPVNAHTPIAARLSMLADKVPIEAIFDWREAGDEIWRLEFETEDGFAVLDQGGARFRLEAETLAQGENTEYRRLYQRLCELVGAGQSDFDLAPLRLVADAFLNGRVAPVPAFDGAAD